MHSRSPAHRASLRTLFGVVLAISVCATACGGSSNKPSASASTSSAGASPAGASSATAPSAGGTSKSAASAGGTGGSSKVTSSKPPSTSRSLPPASVVTGPKGPPPKTRATKFSPTAQRALYKYAGCMRAKGVGFPEPNLSGPGPVFDPKQMDTKNPHFASAISACRAELLAATGASSRSAG